MKMMDDDLLYREKIAYQKSLAAAEQKENRLIAKRERAWQRFCKKQEEERQALLARFQVWPLSWMEVIGQPFLNDHDMR